MDPRFGGVTAPPDPPPPGGPGSRGVRRAPKNGDGARPCPSGRPSRLALVRPGAELPLPTERVAGALDTLNRGRALSSRFDTPSHGSVRLCAGPRLRRALRPSLG